MNNLMPFFIAGGFVVVALIVFKHKKQKSKLKAFVMDAEEAPSLLMMQSVERKLKSIYSNLYENGIKPDAAQGNKAEGKKLQLIHELEMLETAYAEKKINLRNYSDKLQQLQLKTSKL